jgi:hypothetical protein
MSRKTQLLSLVLAAVAVMANQHVMGKDAQDAPKPMWDKDSMPAVSMLVIELLITSGLRIGSVINNN